MKKNICCILLLNSSFLFSQGRDSVPSGINYIEKNPDKVNVSENINYVPQRPIYSMVEKMPEYVGGEIKRKEFIRKNLNFPQKEKDAGITGTCYLTFVINENGSISDIKVLRGVKDCKSCDEEAMKVIKNMPNWIPGEQAGEKKRVQYNLPIYFK